MPEKPDLCAKTRTRETLFITDYQKNHQADQAQLSQFSKFYKTETIFF